MDVFKNFKKKLSVLHWCLILLFTCPTTGKNACNKKKEPTVPLLM